MIRMTDLLKEVKTKEPLVKLFSNIDILDNAKYKNLLIHYVESQYNLDEILLILYLTNVSSFLVI